MSHTSLKQSSTISVLDIGGGNGKRSEELYPYTKVRVVDKKHRWDIEKKGLPKGKWDVILCNHVIEHLVDPDFLLTECYRVMGKDTILDIGTPNLTAWFNRVLFLFGYVPHSMELSTRFNVGKPFDWGKEPLGGHIRIFTVCALVDLLKKYKFKVLSVVGEPSYFPCNIAIRTVDRVLTRLNPSFASMFRIKCKK